ncbi:cysteine desulfurase / selenocysteine lyase [Thermoflexales bacterium]|nr:cysteine desulfurase / selenocysteine lyase [Thermoflexales bacterium]
MLDLNLIRSQFPALSSGAIFLDNPGGTQVAQHTLTRMTNYLVHTNANHEGAFKTSRESDAVVDAARAAVADFLNAARPQEIVFGQNMTSLTLHLSRSLARTLKAGDEIVVTRLDHDANIAPWLLIAEDRGCPVRWVEFDPEDCTWSIEALRRQITDQTKLVAIGYASNAVGTINPVADAVQIAHEAGALVYVDAVQYAPHGPIDVQSLDCDFLSCSAYKFFGPHTGILYGKYHLLDGLKAYKVRPAHNEPPHKFETGTQSFESIAGVHGALEYFEWLGEQAGGDSTRRQRLVAALSMLKDYEKILSRALIEGLSSIKGLHIWGITDLAQLDRRVPTVSFTLDGWHPRDVAAALDKHNLYVWDGNYYALAVTERLGLEDKGGMVRVGAAHYNTLAEVNKLVEAVRALV